MNAYAEHPSQHVWNFQFHKANLSSDVPRVATLRGMKYLLRATVTDNPEDRHQALKELDHAKKLCKTTLAKKERIDQLASTIADLNQKIDPIQDQFDFSKSKLYVDQWMDDADKSTDSFEGQQEMQSKLKPRPDPITDENVIAANLEMDLNATLAAIHLWTAIVLFMNRNFFNGGLCLRKSWKKYNSLYKEVKRADRADIQQDVIDSIEAGVGAFLYSVSVIPSGILKSVLKVIGFKEDQELGIELVWEVLYRQGSEIPMVFLVLSANYLFLASEMDLNSSLAKFRPVIEYCLNRYDTGLTFKFVANVFVKKTGHIHSAISHLKSGIEHCERLNNTKEDDITPSAFFIDLSQAYMHLYEYSEAEAILNKAMEAPFDFTKKGLVALHLAVCQLRLGNEDNLDHLLNQMTLLAKKFKQETYTNTKSKLLAQCKSKEDRNLLLSIAAYEMMYYWREIPSMKEKRRKASIEKFQKEIGNISDISIPDQKAAANIIFGNFIAGEDTQKARDSYNRAIQLKKRIKTEKQWIAFAHYEMANLDYQNGAYSQSLSDLKVVASIKCFPFDDVLKTRAKALERLAKTQVTKQKGLEDPQQRSRAKTV